MKITKNIAFDCACIKVKINDLKSIIKVNGEIYDVKHTNKEFMDKINFNYYEMFVN